MTLPKTPAKRRAIKTKLMEENVATLIQFTRGEKVILDSDLAMLYGVTTKVLKQAVRRNIQRFPDDFMFSLTAKEQECLRSQIVTLDNGRGKHSKYLPMAFTEQGVAMSSGILKSKRAIEVNIVIMRTFVQVRKLIQGNQNLEQKIKELEKLMCKQNKTQNKKFAVLFEAIQKILAEQPRERTMIGFNAKK